MVYKLNERFVLRGWERLPYAVQDIETGNTQFIDELTFRAISFCDGNMDANSPLLLPAHKEIIEKLIENGAVVPCEKGDGLAAYQKYRVCPSRYIKTAHWSVTGRCNYKCRHCYMAAPDAKYGELTHEQCLNIIDQLYECGIANVTLTGGEALVRHDFWELVDRMVAYGINIETIYSNGRLVTEETLDALERRRIKPDFSFSYDGVDGWHNWLRGMDGAENDVARAFKLCRDRGFDTSAELCLHQGNKHLLRESINYLVSLGCGSVKTNPVAETETWEKFGEAKSLAMEELYELYLEYIPKFYEDGAPLTLMLGGFFHARKGSKPEDYHITLERLDGTEKMNRVPICGHARQVMYIAADGKILPCMALSSMSVQDKFPGILNGLGKGLSDSFYMDFIDTRLEQYLAKNPECAACDQKYFCGGGCRASALMFDTDIYAKDLYACGIFKSGYREKIESVIKKLS